MTEEQLQTQKTADKAVQPVSHEAVDVPPEPAVAAPQGEEQNEDDTSSASPRLPELVQTALDNNPRVAELAEQAEAAWQKVRYVDELPDPVLGANGFGHPLETAAGSQRANLSFSQKIPWLKRLDAQSRRAAFEAMALDEAWRAEQLNVAAQVKTTWARLYVLGQRIRINRTNQQLLESLIEVANQRVATGAASQGDVLLGTLELSRVEEQLVTLEQQRASTKAELNRLLNRPADTSVAVPDELPARLPEWALPELKETAFDRQPEILAARLRTQASAWGIRVAELERMPDVTVNFNWFFIDDNRPATRVVDVGRDGWSLGAGLNIPLYREKYDAMEDEAVRRHFASHFAVDDAERRIEAMLADLLEQARAAEETASLYQETILPQARQTLEADQQSYGQGRVEFDRVIRDFRNLLTLEAEYHQALGDLLTANARIGQAVGADPVQGLWESNAQ